MNWNAEAEEIMNERFGKDCLLALATQDGGIPWVRTVNAYYWKGSFYIITHGLSRKMEQIRKNPTVALCGEWFTCHGIAEDLGWFGLEKNREMAEKLQVIFASWIHNSHNDFQDPNTILLRVKVTDRILLSHGRTFEKP